MSGFSLDSCDILANFVSIVPPVSVYRLCFLFGMTLHDRPARTGARTGSSRLPQLYFFCVLFGHPTSAGYFVVLPSSVVPHTRCTQLLRIQTDLPG